MIAMCLKVDEGRILQVLREAEEQFDSAGGEVSLDFSSVHRIDTAALNAMERLACVANARAVKVVLRGVSVGVYKVLKLVKLTSRFSFVS